MTKTTTKAAAENAMGILIKELNLDPKPEWLKKISVDSDDHGYYVEIRILSPLSTLPVKIPSTKDTVKICTMLC